MCPQYLKLHTTLSVSQSVSQTVPSSLNFVTVPNSNHPSSLTVIMIIMDISMVDHFALHPQKRGGLLGTGGEGDERVKARLRIPPEKDRRDRGPPPEQWKC